MLRLPAVTPFGPQNDSNDRTSRITLCVCANKKPKLSTTSLTPLRGAYAPEWRAVWLAHSTSHANMQKPLTAPGADDRYGTLEWFEQKYAKVRDDPWGLTWRPSQQLRYQKVLSTLDALEQPFADVMDVGCATGDFTYLLSKHVRGLQTILGVDFVEDAVERASRRFPPLTFSTESLLAIGNKYPESFDLITCLEILYYVAESQQLEALRSLRRALRPGGYVVFSSMVSPPPYFSPGRLLDLVGCQFEVVRSEVLHLRMISLFEKLGDRAAKVMPRCIAAHTPGRLPFRAVVALERCSRNLRSIAASHTIVLARCHPLAQQKHIALRAVAGLNARSNSGSRT